MRVLLLLPDDDAEAEAAKRWAEQHAGIDVLVRPLSDPGVSHDCDVLWCHAGSRVPVLSQTARDALDTIARDTPLVLSLLATPLAQQLGAAGEAPHVEGPAAWDDASDPFWPESFRDWPDYPHLRGFQGWDAHPLFVGLGTGTVTWMRAPGDRLARSWIPRGPAPELVRIVAVERSYVHLHAEVGVAWEYHEPRRMLCLGSNVHFTAGDSRLDANRDQLVVNALRRFEHDASSGWPLTGIRHAAVSPVPRPRALLPLGAIDEPGTAVEEDLPWSLTSADALVTGTTRSGVGEVWIGELAVLGPLEVSVSTDAPSASLTMISPVYFERTLGSNDAVWLERVAPVEGAPEVAYELAPHAGAQSSQAGVRFSVPLRRQWPYPATALHPLRVETRMEGRRATITVTGCDGTRRAAIYVDGVADLILGDGDVPTITVIALPGEAIRLRIRAVAVRAASLVPSGGERVVEQRALARKAANARGVKISCSDRLVESGWSRAVEQLAGFVATAPDGRRGLLAGLAGSRAGWGESRPGYAWFFGRDTCWTVDAMLAAGKHEEARDAIDFLALTQDARGKIIHELTRSGVAHYDAADSTPLFLRSVAAYARWTGDEESARRWWPAVKRSLAYVAHCDRDGDGLPENTGEGHGWVEMGPLGGGALTSYVASIWIAALRELEPISRWLGDDAMAEACTAAHARAVTSLGRLRLPSGQLALHADVQGRLFPHTTALSAVPIALGVDVGDAARHALEELSQPRFLAPWGLRMLPVDDPRYAPRAYHAGAVWPLFTGWQALAEAKMGNVDRSFDLVRRLISGALRGGTGGFAEVLDGDTGARAGICHDQAWSAAMVVAPIVTGLLGIEAADAGRRCVIRGTWPAALDSARVNGLRIGGSRLEISLTREGEQSAVTVSLADGPSLEVEVGGVIQVVRSTAGAVWHCNRNR